MFFLTFFVQIYFNLFIDRFFIKKYFSEVEWKRQKMTDRGSNYYTGEFHPKLKIDQNPEIAQNPKLAPKSGKIPLTRNLP